VVKCTVKAGEIDVQRRDIVVGAVLAATAALLPAQSASAKDIPLFGLKKKATETVQAAADAASDALSSAEGAVQGAASSLPPLPAVSPVVQAGVVAGAEVVALSVAGLVVGSVLTTPTD